MLNLMKNDIEALLKVICQYENGQALQVDGSLIENIAAKYGFEFVEIKGLKKAQIGLRELVE